MSTDDQEAKYAGILQRARELKEKLGLEPAVVVSHPRHADYAERCGLTVTRLAECDICGGYYELSEMGEIYLDGKMEPENFDGYRCKPCDRE